MVRFDTLIRTTNASPSSAEWDAYFAAWERARKVIEAASAGAEERVPFCKICDAYACNHIDVAYRPAPVAAPSESAPALMHTTPGKYRCKVCGALWRLWPRDEGWSLFDPEQAAIMGKCCDNGVMGEQIEFVGASDLPLTPETNQDFRAGLESCLMHSGTERIGADIRVIKGIEAMRARDRMIAARKSGFASSRARRIRGSIREEMSEKSRKRFEKMTAEEKSEYGRQLVAKRWAKLRAKKAEEQGLELPDDDLVL